MTLFRKFVDDWLIEHADCNTPAAMTGMINGRILGDLLTAIEAKYADEIHESAAIRSYLLTTATFFRDEADDASKDAGERLWASLKVATIRDALMGIVKGRHLAVPADPIVAEDLP